MVYKEVNIFIGGSFKVVYVTLEKAIETVCTVIDY